MSDWDKEIIWPDYHHSSLSLMGSLAGFFGVQAPYGSLPEADQLLAQGFRSVILLVLDGLGAATLEESLPAGSFLRRHQLCILSAVYPCTTVAATASLRTGYPPVHHGRLGWTMYFPQIEASVDVFSNALQFTETQATTFHAADTFLPQDELGDRIQQAGAAQAYAVSAHDAIKARSFPVLSQHVLSLCQQPGRQYVYAYFNEPDHSMHEYGINSQQALQWIQQLDIACETLCKNLPQDCVLLITADHGLVDMRPAIVEHHPELAAMLLRPPVLEPRAAALYVRPEAMEAFPAAFHQAFGDDFVLLTSQQALDRQLYGPGPMLPDIKQYLGDFLALSVSEAALFQKAEHGQLIGMHAGLTRREMLVPLIAVRGQLE